MTEWSVALKVEQKDKPWADWMADPKAASWAVYSADWMGDWRAVRRAVH